MDDATELLVFRDATGGYYRFPRLVLDAARVPESEVTALEAELAAADTAGFAYGAGGELSMIQLQSLVSQRSTWLQLTTSMMNALNSSNKSITGNIR